MCELLCEARTRRGDLTGAVDAARRRIQLEPLAEVGYRTLIQLQADLGDRAGGVSAYHHCASVLERELGISPDPATQEAFQRLVARADTGGPKHAPARPVSAPSGLAPPRPVRRRPRPALPQDFWPRAAAGSAA